MWLEITGRCQLRCIHCYADSGPEGGHGTMAAADWQRVIGEAADVGVQLVQFIGGEPTLHPALPGLVGRALARDLEVEVFTNLVHMTPALWETFSQPRVRLATSWYTDNPAEHAAITGGQSYARTRDGIVEALRRSIPLRVGVVSIHDGQRTQEARAALIALGVTDIGSDDLRKVGRGARGQVPGTGQLCGHCANGNLAVAPDGTVWPCVFARWLPLGNVRKTSLRDVIAGPDMAAATAQLTTAFTPIERPCVPKMCDPQCGPSCSPACRPQCNPQGPCRPRGGCVPNYR
jgi:MoaA/NifB/PqqE/SkfB family radical SAM enzyme